jgi:hypothetical protein
MNDCLHGNLSLVTSAATREDVYELAVKRHPGSIRIRNQGKVTARKK